MKTNQIQPMLPKLIVKTKQSFSSASKHKTKLIRHSDIPKRIEDTGRASYGTLRSTLTVGKKINKWTVCKLPVEDKVEVVCECNYVKTVNFHQLLAGKANYCKKCDKRPDMKSHILYPRYLGMVQRTTDKNCRSWAFHGGRKGPHGGIKVCERWRNGGFWNFVNDVGLPPTPKHQLDRIDNEGDYSPENVRWATAKENGANRANNYWITYKGVKALASQWDDLRGYPKGTVYRRIAAGWTEAGAVDTATREYNKKGNNTNE